MSIFFGAAQKLDKFFPYLKLNLLHAGIKKDSREYIAGALQKTLGFFIFFIIIIGALFFFLLGIKAYLIVVIISFVLSSFFFLRLILLPSFAAGKRIRS